MRLYSLRFSLGSALVGVVVLTTALLGAATFLNVEKYVRSETREKLRSSVAIAALTVDAAAHDTIDDADDEKGEPYLRMKRTLQGVRAGNVDVRYVYTFRKNAEGKIAFVLDAEEDPEKMSHVGDEYDEVTPSLLKAFEAPYAPSVEEEFSTDKWGTWMSGFAPILRADGTIAGVVGMDLSAAKVLAYERRVVTSIVVISIAVCLLVAILGLLFARSISQPLVSLASDMERIQGLDLDGRPAIGSRIREVLHMATALDNMKKGLRSFRRYVPAELVTELIAMRKEAVLGAEKRVVTVFFSDIADFTTYSERLGPDRLSEALGEYFEKVTGIVLANGGTVDKFIGDAVMAFWGAPRPLEEHALAGCRAALGCQRALDELFATWTKRGIPPMPTRIGLNSGEALVGNFGFKDRLSYTALGDSVNLASRLEAVNKFYQTRILISEHTYHLAKHGIVARPVDRVVVKGKTEGVLLYELIAEKGAVTELQQRQIARFTEAFELYLARDWRACLAALEDLVRQTPNDRPSAILRERCEKFLVAPPAADWTGTIVLRDK